MAREIISLNDNEWRIGQCMQWQSIEDVLRWIPASVPGNVQSDLLRAGIIEDPFIGRQNELSRWTDEYNWWYRRDLDIQPGPGRTFIKFEGIDYKSHIFLNGRKLADNEGMYAPVVLEVTELLGKRNTLNVNCEFAGQFKPRENFLKCQMSYGWDFAPTILTVGIWDSVSIIKTGDVFIRYFRVEPIKVTEDYWELQVSYGIDSRKDVKASVAFELEGGNFECDPATHEEKIEIKRGISDLKTIIPLPSPHLWNPWELGKPNLYSLKLRVSDRKRVLDDVSTRFGCRTVELRSNESRNPDEKWTFVVNGKRLFVRGANWVPADSLPGRIDGERYSKLLNLAKQANMNMLRVWGGGIREKADFYDLCDELGILVWQEFPFACGRRPYPKDDKFAYLVKKELTGILDAIHNHPSVAYLSGGNEINITFNRGLVDIFEKLAAKLGGGRPFRSASPVAGESHNYRVWHALANLSDYQKEDTPFLSEFGMQSPPVKETLKKILPKSSHWPIASV
ncbi:MAG TPA: glycoside hydrolase family 2 TIM barrel-domain containing protein, partial [bacterium]|nr:glycoside hydrolase family 2 TIM barrel-domain containing protein [bacterium]